MRSCSEDILPRRMTSLTILTPSRPANAATSALSDSTKTSKRFSGSHKPQVMPLHIGHLRHVTLQLDDQMLEEVRGVDDGADDPDGQ